jgi:hypothetical protein
MDALPPQFDLSQGPLVAYRAMIAGEAITADPSQRMAIERLQDLWVKLRGYDPTPLPIIASPPKGRTTRAPTASISSARSAAANPC